MFWGPDAPFNAASNSNRSLINGIDAAQRWADVSTLTVVPFAIPPPTVAVLTNGQRNAVVSSVIEGQSTVSSFTVGAPARVPPRWHQL